MLQQFCDDASDTVLIENSGVTPEWGCNPFSGDYIVFNENSIACMIAELYGLDVEKWKKINKNKYFVVGFVYRLKLNH